MLVTSDWFACLFQYSNFRGIVLADKTSVSCQYYSQLQKLVVLQLGLVLLPISQCSEAAGILMQLVCDKFIEKYYR